MKAIVLCADDYGQSAAISAGILQLIQRGRLSATSCMTTAPYWSSADNALRTCAGRADIGLHFNLTHPFPGQPPALPLPQLLRRALAHRLDTAALDSALHTQLDRFEAVMERAPDFVDGHQHVHALPQIRTRVLRVLAARYPGAKPYLRAVKPRLAAAGGGAKAALLKLLAAGFAGSARRRGFALNGRFGGIYSLRADADFAALMRRWLRGAEHGELLMCHPGLAADDPDDPIAATRPLEFAFLNGEAFAELLTREHIVVARFNAVQRG